MQLPPQPPSYMRYMPGLGVPLAVAVLGVLAKKLAGKEDWQRSHFYLGSELTLAALATGLLNFFAMGAKAAASSEFVRSLWLNASAIILCFVLLMFVLSLHQDWQARVEERPKASFFWLICVSNLIGFGLLAAVVILIPAP